MKHLFKLFLLFPVLTFSSPAHADDAQSLLTEAKAKNLSVVVYYHGSDWLKGGETFKKEVWDAPKLRDVFKSQLLFTDIDTLDILPQTLSKEMKGVMQGARHPIPFTFGELKTDRPGVNIRLNADNRIEVSGENPEKVVYEWSFTPSETVQNPLICLRFHKSEAFRARSESGNFCMTELELLQNQNPLPPGGIWANASNNNNEGPDNLIDGDLSENRYWCVNSNSTADDAVLVFTPKSPLRRGEKLTLKLKFLSRHARHATLLHSLFLYDDPAAANAMKRIHENRLNTNALKPFQWSPEAYPALALFDDDGRLFAKVNAVYPQCQNEAQFTRLLRQILECRRQRDLAFTSAEKNTDAVKARELARGLSALEKFLPLPEILKIYKNELDLMRKSDPQDRSGMMRKLSFNTGDLVKRLENALRGKTFSEGEKALQDALTHPQNALLSPEQKQSIYLAGYNFYRQCPDKTQEKWKMLRNGAQLAPESHLGLGMRGVLAMNGAGEVGIPYGWQERHLPEAVFDWNITMGCKRYFREKGRYRLTLNHRSGGGLNIQLISLSVNGKILWSTTQAQTLSTAEKERSIEITLSETPPENASIVLRIQGSAVGGASSGSISVRPLLPE